MNYPQARRRARTVFGPDGDARMVKVGKSLFQVTYTVGVVQNREFKPLGAGNSWEEAFASVKEVPAKETVTAESPSPTTANGVQRVKL